MAKKKKKTVRKSGNVFVLASRSKSVKSARAAAKKAAARAKKAWKKAVSIAKKKVRSKRKR